MSSDDGAQLIVEVPLIDAPIQVTIWKIAVGTCAIYLLDTDIPQNDPWNRTISARFYSGDMEQPLRQEIALGIGGAETLEKLGLKCHLIHLNEGHAAFVLLERIRDCRIQGMAFDDAFAAARKQTIFTTHTPVPAGHDSFPFFMMEIYFRSCWPDLGLDHRYFLELGVHPQYPDQDFNMTVICLW